MDDTPPNPAPVARPSRRRLLVAAPVILVTACLWVKLVHVSLSLRETWWAPEESLVEWIADHPDIFTATLASVLAILAPVVLLPRRTRVLALLILHLLVTTLALADRVHAHFFGNLVPMTRLWHAGQLRWVASSVLEQLSWTDGFYYLDLLLVGLFLPWYVEAERDLPRTSFLSRLRSCTVLVLGAFVLAGPTAVRWARDANGASALVNLQRDSCTSIGLLPCHVADVASRAARRRPGAREDDLSRARHFLEKRHGTSRPSELSGIAAGRNVILIIAESLQVFPIDLVVGGQPICPRLSALSRESLNFVNFYDQTHLGTTADGEFSSLQSLHPLPDAVVAWEYPHHHYFGLPAVLAAQGYATLSASAVDAGFWNRSVMHPRLGFQRSLFEDSYRVSERVGMWLGDREFLEQTVPRLQAQPEPFFAYLLTATNHHPFALPVKYRHLKLGTLEGTYLGDYLHSVNYFDGALGAFLDRLDRVGLLARSVIVLYGDHQGFLGYPPELARMLALPERSEFASFRFGKRLPLLIRLPGAARAGVRTPPGGHLDVPPTVLGLLGIQDERGVMLGRDLTGGSSFVVFRDGSFADSQHYFINRFGPISKASCYEVETGGKLDCSRLEGGLREALEELRVSDSIIRGDLIPALRASVWQAVR